MHLARLAPLVAVVVLAAACSGGSATAAPATRATTAPLASADASVAATRLEVTLSDALVIKPETMTVPAGKPITFVVTNDGTALHEFVLGDESQQMAHEQEMASAGGMRMPRDEEMAIGIDPGKTKELTVTFDEPGVILAGCHVSGHYAAGMKATITVE